MTFLDVVAAHPAASRAVREHLAARCSPDDPLLVHLAANPATTLDELVRLGAAATTTRRPWTGEQALQFAAAGATRAQVRPLLARAHDDGSLAQYARQAPAVAASPVLANPSVAPAARDELAGRLATLPRLPRDAREALVAYASQRLRAQPGDSTPLVRTWAAGCPTVATQVALGALLVRPRPGCPAWFTHPSTSPADVIAWARRRRASTPAQARAWAAALRWCDDPKVAQVADELWRSDHDGANATFQQAMAEGLGTPPDLRFEYARTRTETSPATAITTLMVDRLVDDAPSANPYSVAAAGDWPSRVSDRGRLRAALVAHPRVSPSLLVRQRADRSGRYAVAVAALNVLMHPATAGAQTPTGRTALDVLRNDAILDVCEVAALVQHPALAQAGEPAHLTTLGGLLPARLLGSPFPDTGPDSHLGRAVTAALDEHLARLTTPAQARALTELACTPRMSVADVLLTAAALGA